MHQVVSNTFYLTKVLSVENTRTKAPLWSGADVERHVPPHRGSSEGEEIPSAGKGLAAAGMGGMILRNRFSGQALKEIKISWCFSGASPHARWKLEKLLRYGNLCVTACVQVLAGICLE